MQNLSDDNFEQVLKENQKTIVLFSATWCGPCKALKPAIVQLASKYPNVNFEIVDIEQTPKFTSSMKIFTVPTTILFEGDKPIKRVSGNLIHQIQDLFL